LKRADELENVGQKQAALQALHDIITSKKHRTWSKTYESIMFKHIDLAVEMKKRNYAKEALMSYRNMCQQVNINSLEEVIKYYLRKASEKAEEAQTKAAAVTIDVEDLEEDASPEDIMLSYVSKEKGKDRTDRELVTPWFRFLWEAYRSVLEILRTNPKLEPLYAMTANKAFAFCLQYKRHTEFRRLCDILRQHLTNLTNRYRENREAQPESLQMHLETRFEQLKVACELELWAEAFRSVEDIQALVTLAKKAPKQQMMATYYARLTQIFAVSENHVYHAYAWLKLFNFTKAYNKNMTPGDLQLMACSVLLATLSILPYDRNERHGDDAQAEQEKERIMRMANILGFAVDSKKDYKNILSRGALLGTVSAMNILAAVPPEVRQIYELLTSDFNPLELCGRLAPLFEKLKEAPTAMSAASPVKEVSLAMYVNSLKQVAVLRLLKQLSEVYSTLKISSLAAMVPFASFGEVEAIVVDAVKAEFLQVRIDHRNGTLHFGSQQLESERVRTHLSVLARRLSKALHLISPAAPAEKEAKRAELIATALVKVKEEHVKANARKVMIEKRKEEQEQLMQQQEAEERARREQQAREAELAEERRKREEAARREKERIERELEEKDAEEARQMLEAVQKKRGPGAKVVVFKEGEKLDKRALMAEAMTERLKEQQELERKMTKMAKQLDHLERARREEEAPYLEEAYKKRTEEDRKLYEEQQQELLAKHRAAWEVDIVEKQRLSIMLGEKEAFQAQIISRREEEFQALQVERERRLEERRRQLKVEREMNRRRAFVDRCVAMVEAREEALLAEARAAEEEKRMQEQAEMRRKVEEEAARARQREAEIEAKLREEKEAERNAPPAAGGGNRYVPPRRAGDAPPPAASRPAGDDWRSSRPAPAAGGPPPSREDDRWGSRPRDTGSSSGGGAPPPAASSGSGGGASKFVPPAMRRQMEAEAAGGSAPASRSDDRDRPPPSSGGGGAYRPPGRR